MQEYEQEPEIPSEQSPTLRPRLGLGVRLEVDAYTASGVLLMRAGSIIANETALRRLKGEGVLFGDPGDATPPECCCPTPAPEQNADTAAQLQERMDVAVELRGKAISDVETVFTRIEAGGTVDLDLARESVSSMLGEMLDDPRALTSLVHLKEFDNYTFQHSVNVCTLAIYMAVNSDLKDHAEEIGLGAILHDIGKARIPKNILNKPDQLDPHEKTVMDRHPTLGAEILAEAKIENEIAIACVLDHHEKRDGAGYPSGKSGNQISAPAAAVGIADIYDALTTDRPYRAAMNPRDALMFMNERMRHELHSGLLRTFVTRVGYFPVGSEVVLSDGCVARIIDTRPDDPLRPVVELILDPLGRQTRRGQLLDLAAEDGIYIRDFWKARSAVDVAREAA